MRYLILLVSLFIVNSVFACPEPIKKNVLWYYNQADKVFVGKVIQVGNVKTNDFTYREKGTNILTYKVRLVVKKSYRGDLPDTIDIGKRALAKTIFSKNETYLIYADYIEEDSILAVNNNLHVLDPRMERHAVLDEIFANPNGTIQEKHPTTEKVLSEGSYINGVPIGKWKYYSKSGELEEAGHYNENGKRQGKWFTFFVTDDRYYNLFEAIKTKKAANFELISFEEIKEEANQYKYKLTYRDRLRNKKNSIDYYYKKPIIERMTIYENGKLHGKEELYNEYGKLMGFQNYENGLLDGVSEFIQIRLIDGKEYKTVYKSLHESQSIIREVIYHYENDVLVNEEVTIDETEPN